jgi:hypothetical protein
VFRFGRGTIGWVGMVMSWRVVGGMERVLMEVSLGKRKRLWRGKLLFRMKEGSGSLNTKSGFAVSLAESKTGEV